MDIAKYSNVLSCVAVPSDHNVLPG